MTNPISQEECDRLLEKAMERLRSLSPEDLKRLYGTEPQAIETWQFMDEPVCYCRPLSGVLDAGFYLPRYEVPLPTPVPASHTDWINIPLLTKLTRSENDIPADDLTTDGDD